MDAFKPSSLTDAPVWDSYRELVQKDPALQKLLKDVEAIPLAAPHPTAADYLAAKRSNDRARLDDHWRKDRPKQAVLVLNRALKGIQKDDPDDRLLNWLFASTFEPTWTVSAHLPNNDLPTSGLGQLDLAGCEMAMEMAETREVLLPWMQSVTKTLDVSIVREIDRRCLKLFGEGDQQWWADTKKPETMNWSGVCGGSLLAACESLAAQGFDRPATRKRAIEVVRFFVDKGFTPAGECDEGIGYWCYGVEFACLGMSRLPEDALVQEIDLDRLRQVAAFPGSAHLAGRTFFASNDSGASAGAPLMTYWLSQLTGDSFLSWWYANHFSGDVRTVPELLRLLKYKMLPPATQSSAPKHPPARYLKDQQVAIFQQETRSGLISFTMTGGHNAENHNHNDLGTFQYFLGETALIPDLGAPHYTTDFFGKERYTRFMVAASSGHCCPNINGHEQRTGRDAHAELIGYDEKARSLELDITSAYPKEAGLKKWIRKATMSSDGAVVISDLYEIESGEIVHRIWFADQPRVTADGIIETGKLHLSLSPKPAKIEVPTFKAGDERLALRIYPADKTLYRVDATYKANASQPIRVETTLQRVEN